jgi:hypothetical protein
VACGKQGELQKPGPLAAKRTPEQVAAERLSQAQRPVTTIDRRDDPTNTDQIEGSGPNALAPGPPGVLPDPYLYPR